MRRFKRLLRVAFRSIVKNRMRSLLTSLGVIIGVAAVIVMVGIGAGAQADVEAQISSMGVNTIIIFPQRGQSGNVSLGAGTRNMLTLDDAEQLVENATLLTAVSPIVRVNAQIIGGTGNWNTHTYGVTPEYLDIRGWAVETGEIFTERDVRTKAKVALLGKTVIEELFPATDPVGQQIRVRNTPFKVIGTLSEKGTSPWGSDYDDVVLIPATTGLYRLSGGRNISMINVSAASLEQSEAAIEEVTQIIRESHRLRPEEEDDFRIYSQAELMETATETQRVMTLLLGAVAAVSLVVGGIGIMNIMLVSVTERTREIGIRLAVGARGADVMTQFLTESVVLSLFGGTIGTALAYGVVYLLNNVVGMTTLVNPSVVFLAFGFAAAIGVFFGYYPARKAAMLNPIDALRYE
jgi:putative ABC transport system permease protein